MVEGLGRLGWPCWPWRLLSNFHRELLIEGCIAAAIVCQEIDVISGLLRLAGPKS